MKHAALVLVLSCMGLGVFAQQRPPTPDPTYGLPLPEAGKAVALKPDAKWIWTSETKNNQKVFLRKSFSLDRQPAHASLFVTADDYFTVYVNGTELGKTASDPNDDSVWAKVHRYDIANLLKPEQNVVAVVGENAGGLAGVLARVQVEGMSPVLSDATWKVSETAPGDNWTAAEFSDASWAKAHIVADAGSEPWGNRLTGWPVPVSVQPAYLAHLPMPPVSVAIPTLGTDLTWTPTTKSLRLIQPEPGKAWKVVVDFGEELPGRVSIQSTSALDVNVGTGESAEEALDKPWTSMDMQLEAGKPSASAYTAFRYASLLFPARTPSVDLSIEADHLYYPVEYKGSFDCSDQMLTKLWYIGAYTAHSCMQQDIWDAPKRDRARWMGDLHVSGEVINNVFADKFLMEQTMTRLREEAQGGHPMNAEPVNHVNGIPGYSCAWIAGLADFYRHVGDMGYVRKQHDAIVSMLEYFRGELDSNGVFANKRKKWPFVDWSPGFNEESPTANAATHLFLVKAVHEAVFLLGEMGDHVSAMKYNKWADELTSAAQNNLTKEGSFGMRRQENAMAIYSGVADETEQEAIYGKVFRSDLPTWNEVATPYYNNYVIFALAMSGHSQDALSFVRSFWEGMAAEGATTFWEGYDPSWEKTHFHAHLQADNGTGYFVSLCHGWSAGPTNFLTERILGVRPTSGGFRTCDIEPELCDLQWASGEVPTPRGNLKVAVKKVGVALNLELTVPSAVQANVILPPGVLTVNGKPMPGKPREGKQEIVLGSGHYSIRAG
jgi:hypothetical protein